MKAIGTALLAVAGSAALAAPAPGAVQVSQSGWAWGNPQPQGNTIRALDVVAGRGYAVGDAGTALRTDDGGATFTGLNTGTSAALERLQIVTPDVLVVQGGGGCVVRRSDDGGRTFRRVFALVERDCPDPVQAVSFVTPQRGYLVLRDGAVLRTDDGGETVTRVTALPGSPASPGGGGARPSDVVFTAPDSGLAFIAGSSQAFRTTDGGNSWTPAAGIAPGDVRRVRFVDATTAYAVGPNTLLRSTDGGQTFERRPGGDGQDLTGVSCADPQTCVLTTTSGERVLRTTDGGATVTAVTASTQRLFGAAFASPTRVLSAGDGGATVVSDDGGVNFRPVGGDTLGASYPVGLRPGPGPDIAFALGRRGQLARTDDGGNAWRAISLPASADLRDLSFATTAVGFALDARGGLFRTGNGGQSWQPLDPGTTSPARAVLTSGSEVLLAGPVGVRRQIEGGRFELVATRVARRARVDQFDRAGTSVVAFGTTAAVLSTDRGRSWQALPVPSQRRRTGRVTVRIRDLDMTDARRGFLLDTTGRLWATTNRGRTWTEAPGVGTEDGSTLAMASPTQGFLTLTDFAGDPQSATVLRTSDGGRTWRPQRLAVGDLPIDGIVAPTTTRAYAITGRPDDFRSLCTTATGGDVGQRTTVTVTAQRRTLTRAQLRRAGGRVAVRGTLAGAQGGEPIVVASRPLGGGTWTKQVVQAGANGGSFTASVRATGSTVVVAQFAGDSGRTGAGSRPLVVRVR